MCFYKDGKFYFFLFFLVLLTLVNTYPLFTQAGLKIHADHMDPMFVIWIFGWNFHCFEHGMDHYFHAPIFYPETHTFLHSETLITLSVLLYPFYWISQNLVLSYNVSLGLAFLLNGIAAYLFAYKMTSNRLAAAYSGIVFSNSTFFYMVLRRPHLMYGFFSLFGLYILSEYMEKGGIWRLLLYILLSLAQLTTNVYWTVGHIIASALLCLCMVPRYFQWKKLIYLIVAVLLLGIQYFLYYNLYQSSIVHDEHVFSSVSSDLAHRTTTLANYVWPSQANVVYRNIIPTVSIPFPEFGMFFGFGALVFLGIGLYRSVFAENKHVLGLEGHVWMGIILLFGVMVILFGLHPSANPIQKFLPNDLRNQHSLQSIWLIFLLGAFLLNTRLRYFASTFYHSAHPLHVFFVFLIITLLFLTSYYPVQWLFYYIPQLLFFRMPGRLGMFLLFSFSVIAGMGIHMVLKRFSSSWIQYSIVFVFVCVTGFENHINNAFIDLYPPGHNDPAYQWLKKQDQIEAIVVLPMHSSSITIHHQYDALMHNKKLINGYSGYFPWEYNQFVKKMEWFPSTETINEVKKRECDLVMIRHEFMDDEEDFEYYKGMAHLIPWFEIKYEDDNTIAFSILEPQETTKLIIHINEDQTALESMPLYLKAFDETIPFRKLNAGEYSLSYLPPGNYILCWDDNGKIPIREVNLTEDKESTIYLNEELERYHK